MKPGTEVKIIKGDHRGKKGKVGSNRPSNALQKGKLPIVVGNRNQVIWTRPEWVSENFLAHEPNTQSPMPNAQCPMPDFQLADVKKRILGYLMTRKVPVLDVEIAIALELPIHQYLPALKHLEEEGLVIKSPDDEYQLASFSAGYYVTDGKRTGLISHEDKGIFTVTFGDDDDTGLQCTIEDLRENFTICGKQLELLDSSRVSADSVEPDNSSADLNGSSQSNSTTMPLESSKTTLTTPFTTEISETTTPDQEPQNATPLASPATTQATPATEQDYSEKNQDSGWKHSVALLKDYLNSSLSSNQKESFIVACEQSLGDSEWQVTLGTIRSSYKQRKLELASVEREFLSCPTLTACVGKTSRPAGSTRCEKWFVKQGIVPNSQCLSAEMMAAICGYPLTWTACLSQLNPERQDELEAATSLDEQSSPSKLPLPSSESNISIPSPGKQWLDPHRIILKEGTQSRDVDELFSVNVSVVQNYAEMMEQGLWEWEREPLPVAFLAADGKIYAGDCHHRVSAAIAAGKEIYVNLLSGELVDAVLYSCQANTYHGLLLRPKDQRKRIELFLDTLAGLDEVRSQSLLQSIPNLTEIERKNGKWSTRVIAKYLRLTESGYRTIINIVQERELAEKFTQFSDGDWVCIKSGSNNLVGVPEGTKGKIQSFDKRRGIFIVPASGSLDADGRMLPSFYVHPDYLEETDAPIEIEKISQPPAAPTSVREELKQKAEELGIPVDGLPEAEHNQGSPDTLVDDRPFANPHLVAEFVDVESFIGKIGQLPDKEIKRVWDAIAPRISLVEKFSRQIINLESFDNEDLQDLIAYANELLESRQGGTVDAP